MDEPVIAATKPCLVALVEGSGIFGAVAGSAKPSPFATIRMSAPGSKPVLFKAQETDEELLCACKRTQGPPYCDGSHNSLSASYGAPMEDTAADAAVVARSADANGAARVALDAHCFVINPAGVATIREGTLALYPVIGPDDGARRLSQFAGSAAPGIGPIVQFAGSDTVIYVIDGRGAIEIGDRHFDLPAESGAYVRAGEAFRITASGADAAQPHRLPARAAAKVPRCDATDFDDSVPNRIEAVDPSKRAAMADRYYQVLVDGETQGTEVTQFIGHIPQSRAAHHRHLYEETLTVLSGEGMMWTDSTRTPIGPGDTIFLPRKQSHSVECTSAEGMMLIGVFYPSMSPAINY